MDVVDLASPGNSIGGNEALTCFLLRSSDPVVAVDDRGRIVFANARAARLFGYSAEELLGAGLRMLLPHCADVTEPQPQVVTHDGPAPADDIVVRSARRKDGSEISVDVRVTPLDLPTQSFFVCTVRDLTNRVRARQQITRGESRLNEAQRIAKIGNWEWDIVTGSHWWSDELFRILENDPAQAPSFASFLDMMQPQDRQRVHEGIERALANDSPYALDVRLTLPSGTEKIVQTQGEVTFDAEGRALRMTGTLQDVTERKSIETALRLSQTRYMEAQRIAKIGNWEWNLVTNEEWWSDELYAILEEDPRTFATSFDNFLRKVHPVDRPFLAEGKKGGIPDMRFDPVEFRLVVGEGREKVVEQRIDLRRDEQGQPAAVIGTIRDVTERWQLENQLRESEERFASTVELAAIGIAHVDRGGRFIWANNQLCGMLGYTKEELVGLTIKQISHPEDSASTDELRSELHAGLSTQLKAEKRYVCKDGRVIWVRISSSLRRDAAGQLLYDISTVEDISERKAAEARVQYMATHDEMTGLPNRAMFTQLVNHEIESAKRDGRQCAVLFIDLDRFKIVNDSLGHEAGDLLLKEMAERLKGSVRKADVVARLGGDEFVVLLPELTDGKAAAEVAKKILSAALEPVLIGGQECRVTASIGIAAYPADGNDTASLLKNADVAMYLAKEEGKNNFQLYSAESSPMSVERLTLETLLSRALERRELSIQYQAKVDLDTGVITGAEALLRWWNHELGTVPPAQFIPVAEDSGLIVPIGKWVMRTACEQNMAWQRQGFPRIVMAVNLSPRQFKDPGLLDDIAEVLAQTGLDPELLELEITESMIMHNVDQAAARVSAIKKLGVRLALDDFGTGYSSLSQLKRFPIDTLKVDRSFVRDIPASAEDRAITEAIISLGRTLGVTVVAEGVETSRQKAFLHNLACNEMQGFHFSKPCHPDAFALLMAESFAGDEPQVSGAPRQAQSNTQPRRRRRSAR